MSNFNELAKKHAEDQEKIGKDWSKARKEAKDRIQKDIRPKTDELKNQLNKLKEEEQQISTNLDNSDKQSAQELAKITAQLSLVELKNKGSVNTSIDENEAEIDKQIELLRNERMNQIWSQTLKDINTVIEKHKQSVISLDQSLNSKRNDDKKSLRVGDQSSHQLNALKAQEKAIFDQRLTNLTQMFANLERVRKDIDKKTKEISELDQTEKDKIQKIDEKTVTNEQKERKEEMEKFLGKVKLLSKKSSFK